MRSDRPAVFLDRDGVLNETPLDGEGRPLSPRSLRDLIIDPSVPALLESLATAGYLRVVVTNQPDVARGSLDQDVLDALHAHLQSQLPIDAIYVCIHDNEDRCACRKPGDGMLRDAAADLSIDLGASWLVGDRWVDIAAGRAAGVRTVLIRHDASWMATSSGQPAADLVPDVTVASLAEAVAAIIGEEPPPLGS